jgi:4-amino-4-deoxy-L-arabinose transferase-like glycosyltransferase
LTAQALNLFGVSEWSARLVSAIIGTLTIPILYFPARKMFSNQVALIALLLLAVSPWHIYWSQNARGYTSLMLFYTLALFSLYFGIERDRPKYLIFFFILIYLASSERMIAIFILPVIALYLILLKVGKYKVPPGFRAKNLLILLSPVILLIIYQVFSSMISGQSIIADIVDEIITTFYGKSIENPFTQLVFIAFELGIPLMTFSLISGLFWLSQKSRLGLLMILGAVVPLILVVLITPFMFIEERYVFMTLPSWLFLAAYGVNELFTRYKSVEKIFVIGIIILLLADAMGSNLMYFHTNNGNRRDWRSAFSIVELNSIEDDLVVSTWPELGAYYLGTDVKLWQDVDLDTVIDSNKRIWFVVIPDMAWYTNSIDLYWWVEHNCRLTEVLYLRTVDNTNLEIYLCDPSNTANSKYLRYSQKDPENLPNEGK